MNALILSIFFLAFGFFHFNCSKKVDSPTSSTLMVDTKNTSDNSGAASFSDTLEFLESIGFPKDLVGRGNDMFLIDNCIAFRKANIPNISKLALNKGTQYQTLYLVSPRTLYVKIDPSIQSWASIITNSINAWNSAGAAVKFQITTSTPDITIYSDVAPSCPSAWKNLSTGTCAMADFPTSSGLPGSVVSVKMNSQSMPTAASKTTVLTHELGHCIGFRHTNWNGLMENSAVAIGCTSTDPGSIMNGNTCGQLLSVNDGDKFSLNYLYPNSNDPSPTFLLSDYGSNQGWGSQDINPRLIADVTGDGLSDVVGFANDGIYVAKSNGTGFNSKSNWLSALCKNQGWTAQSTYPRVLADVNGDGKADVVGFGDDGVYVCVSNGNGFNPYSKWVSAYAKSIGWPNYDQYPRFSADVNSDGKSDIIGFAAAGCYVSLSNGNSFGPGSLFPIFGGNQGWGSQNINPRFIADVNGDGRADIVGFANNGVYVAIANTQGGFGSPMSWESSFWTQANGWNNYDIVPRCLSDVNGDGKADIIGFGGFSMVTSLSNGSSFTSTQNRAYHFCKSRCWSSQTAMPRTAGRIYSADNRSDVLGFDVAGIRVINF